MIKRFHKVKLSVFGPERKKWVKRNNMTVLINDNFIYAVSAEHFYQEYSRVCDEDVDFKKAEDRNKKAEIAEAIFEKMLDKCIISETLQGEIYSKNTVWKIEREEKSFSDMGGDKA